VVCRRIFAAGVTFYASSRILRDVSDVMSVVQVPLGTSDLKVANCIRSTVAFVIQTIPDVLHAGPISLPFISPPPSTLATLTSVLEPTSPVFCRPDQRVEIVMSTIAIVLFFVSDSMETVKRWTSIQNQITWLKFCVPCCTSQDFSQPH
jgi:hypothetical protein